MTWVPCWMILANLKGLAILWLGPEDMKTPHHLPVSPTPIRKPDLYRLGVYHLLSRKDHWVSENLYIEVRLIRTEQTRRYLSIYAIPV